MYAFFYFRYSYGDKTPRSVPGRCFGILWITIGIVMMSVLTATLAAAFTVGDRPFGSIVNKNVSKLCFPGFDWWTDADVV